jgi:hypothetical protein
MGIKKEANAVGGSMKYIITVLWFVCSVVIFGCKDGIPPVPPGPIVYNVLSWNEYFDLNAEGFYIYWKMKDNIGAVYNIQNRYKIDSINSTFIKIKDMMVLSQPVELCFVMTAYNKVDKETSFSNETCGLVN